MTVVGDIRSAARGGNTGSPPLMGSITATGLVTIRQRQKTLQQDWPQLDSAMICQKKKYCSRIGQNPNKEEENRFI
jgi:hypothetical protein